MRIVGGTLKGRRFNPPRSLPTRPTTDFAKEALFNILENNFDLAALNVLDLFSGTGNMSYEFASRGCKDITCVDRNESCLKYIRKMADELNIDVIQTVRENVFKLLPDWGLSYDLIFADPPYDLPRVEDIPDLVFEYNLLNKGGWFILEHQPKLSFDQHNQFIQRRNYGSSIFSIFEY